MSARDKVHPEQFGPLYHGAATAGIEELNSGGRDIYHAMPGSGYHSYVTTSRGTAEEYARAAAQHHNELHERGKVDSPATPTVYQVSPQGTPGEDYDWEVDPHSGPNGWNDGPSMEDALELASYGDEGGPGVNLRFSNGALKTTASWPVEPEEHQRRRY